MEFLSKVSTHEMKNVDKDVVFIRNTFNTCSHLLLGGCSWAVNAFGWLNE